MSLKVVMLVVALLSFGNVKAQTFVCTDVTFTEQAKKDWNESHRYNTKKNVLGSTLTLNVFDRNLKAIEEDTDGTLYEYVFKKIGEYKYRFEDTMTDFESYNYYTDSYNQRKVRMDMDIQTRLGYYVSTTIRTYYDGKLMLTLSFKRK